MPSYKGGNTQLLLQRQTAYRTVPGVPAAFKMKYSDIDIGDGESYIDDPTIKSTPLMEKRDDGDESPSFSASAILCLNDIGQWLALLWGAPVTTGTGPYTHTFTLSLNDRPSALIELGYTDATKYRRWLDLMINTLSWSVVDGNQSIKLEGAMSSEVKPRPGAVWQAAPTSYAKNRACVKSGNVYDVLGSSTLGRISQADVSVENNMEFMHLADDKSGYGAAIMGQPEISGSLSAVFDSTTSILTYMEDHTSVPLVLVGKNLAGDASLTLTLPKVEFDKPKYSVKTSKGLVLDTNWRAHADAVAPTFVLVNGVATYAA